MRKQYLVLGSDFNVRFAKYFDKEKEARDFIEEKKSEFRGKRFSYTLFKLGPLASPVHIQLDNDHYMILDTNEEYYSNMLSRMGKVKEGAQEMCNIKKIAEDVVKQSKEKKFSSGVYIDGDSVRFDVWLGLEEKNKLSGKIGKYLIGDFTDEEKEDAKFIVAETKKVCVEAKRDIDDLMKSFIADAKRIESDALKQIRSLPV